MPPNIVESWRRSDFYGVDYSRPQLPYRGETAPAGSALAQLSSPVLDRMLDQIGDEPVGIVLADRVGSLTHRGAGQRRLLSTMDNHQIDLGFNLAESEIGTNGVGTSLETKRPTLVVGDQHYLESLKSFSCANAPIVHPITNRLEGTVGLLCGADNAANPLLLPAASMLASQIRQLLLDHARPEERALLDQFLLARKRTNDAVVTMNADVLIASPAAQPLLIDFDQARLWDHVVRALQQGQPGQTELPDKGGQPIRLRCRPVHLSGKFVGAVVEFLAESPPASRAKHSPPRRLPGLVGRSVPWQGVVRQSHSSAHGGRPVLFVGERGTGRLAIAKATATLAAAGTVKVVDSSYILIDGRRAWLRGLRNALRSENTVIIRHADRLPTDIAEATAALLDDAPSTARLLGTSEVATSQQAGVAAVLDRLGGFRIEVPPLRHRRDDISVLALAFLDGHGHQSIPDDFARLLYSQPWPGNLVELHQTLKVAVAKSGNQALALHHLPKRLSAHARRPALHGLRQQEADAIIEALATTEGNKHEAARLLGISRATLYRRINSYRLDPDNLTPY